MLGSPEEGPIRQFMRDRGVDIGALADAVEVSRKTISLAVNGEPMTWAVLSRIALALDVNPDAIAEPIEQEVTA